MIRAPAQIAFLVESYYDGIYGVPSETHSAYEQINAGPDLRLSFVSKEPRVRLCAQ